MKPDPKYKYFFMNYYGCPVNGESKHHVIRYCTEDKCRSKLYLHLGDITQAIGYASGNIITRYAKGVLPIVDIPRKGKNGTSQHMELKDLAIFFKSFDATYRNKISENKQHVLNMLQYCADCNDWGYLNLDNLPTVKLRTNSEIQKYVPKAKPPTQPEAQQEMLAPKVKQVLTTAADVLQALAAGKIVSMRSHVTKSITVQYRVFGPSNNLFARQMTKGQTYATEWEPTQSLELRTPDQGQTYIYIIQP